MQIIRGQYPPNYKAIAEVFNIENYDGIVFTYGDDLYVPGGKSVPLDRHLMIHEETHQHQQNSMGVENWWDKYLVDVSFRFGQELEAYRNQYKSMNTLPLNVRLDYLDHLARDLSGPMYGNIMTKDEAKAYITEGIILKHPKTKAGQKIRKLKKRARQNRKKGRK